MSSLVRLRYFSLPEIPPWRLSAAEEGKFKSWVASFRTLAVEPAVTVADLPTTGYRGFEVTIDGHTNLVYRNALVGVGGASPSGPGSGIETMLFQANAEVLEHVFGLTLAGILQPAAPVTINGLGPTCSTQGPVGGGLRYSAEPWRSLPMTNCYNYANDAQSPNAVFPGDRPPETFFSALTLTQALVDDGLQFRGCAPPGRSLDGGSSVYVVALIERDTMGAYHFLRLDQGGCWSQKLGSVSNHDDQRPSRLLFDLCQARFQAPFELVGFFVSTPDVKRRLERRGAAVAPVRVTDVSPR